VEPHPALSWSIDHHPQNREGVKRMEISTDKVVPAVSIGKAA
jgi:hypothetical protein